MEADLVMEAITWKKFFDVLAFVIVFVVPLILYLMEKAGASLTWIFVVGWLSIAAAALYLVLSIPWVWAEAPIAVRVWRIALVCSAAVLSAGYGAIKIWPRSGTMAHEIMKPVVGQVSPEKNGTSEVLPPTTSDVHATVRQAPTQTVTAEVGHAEPKAGKLNHVTSTQVEPSAPTQKEQPPVIIETAATFGNLADRAISVSDEIMQDLYLHGWKNWANRPGQQTLAVQQMPNKPDEIEAWTRSRSGYFRFRFFERVLEIRNEFAQLHLRDQRLDDFFKYQGMIEQANRQMAAANPGREIDSPILPQTIEEVAERLKVLANQIPTQRAAPKPLHFSVTRVQPEKPEFSFQIVTTIDTEMDISAGYIAVEFDGPRASIATDFVDSKLVFLNDENIIGNKPLKEYLLAHATDSYILAVGKTPFTSKKPIHVVAAGVVPFNVAKVILFDK